MNLKEQAEIVFAKMAEIGVIKSKIEELCDVILTEKMVKGKIVKFSDGDKQLAFQAYQAYKAELQVLVEALP